MSDLPNPRQAQKRVLSQAFYGEAIRILSLCSLLRETADSLRMPARTGSVMRMRRTVGTPTPVLPAEETLIRIQACIWTGCPHTWPPACSSSAGHVAAISRAPGSLTQSTKNDNLVPHDPGNPPFRKRCSLGYQPGSSRSRQRRGLAFLRWGCGQH